MRIDHAWVCARILLPDSADTSQIRSLVLPGIHDEKVTELGDALDAFTGIEVLDLSRNALTSIDPLASSSFPHLRKLNLYYNRLPDLDALAPLAALPALRELDLRLNPVSKVAPSYRLRVIAAFPNLTRLDERDVRESERRAAARLAPPTPAPVSPPLQTRTATASRTSRISRPHPPPSPSLLSALIESPTPAPRQALPPAPSSTQRALVFVPSPRRTGPVPREPVDDVVDALMDVLANGPQSASALRAQFKSALLCHIDSLGQAPPSAMASAPPAANAEALCAEIDHLQAAAAREKAHSAQLSATVEALNRQIAALTTELERAAVARDDMHAATAMLKEAHAALLANNEALLERVAAQDAAAEANAAAWKANFDELVALIPDGRGVARQ